MNESRGASGIQIAFLVFAVLLLGAPVERYVLPMFGWTGEYASTTARLVVFVPAIVALLAFPHIRRRCLDDLRVGIPRERRAEVAVVSMLHWMVAAAGVGGVVLWYWLLG